MEFSGAGSSLAPVFSSLFAAHVCPKMGLNLFRAELGAHSFSAHSQSLPGGFLGAPAVLGTAAPFPALFCSHSPSFWLIFLQDHVATRAQLPLFLFSFPSAAQAVLSVPQGCQHLSVVEVWFCRSFLQPGIPIPWFLPVLPSLDSANKPLCHCSCANLELLERPAGHRSQSQGFQELLRNSRSRGGFPSPSAPTRG